VASRPGRRYGFCRNLRCIILEVYNIARPGSMRRHCGKPHPAPGLRRLRRQGGWDPVTAGEKGRPLCRFPQNMS
jgi:hypothetical protein